MNKSGKKGISIPAVILLILLAVGITFLVLNLKWEQIQILNTCKVYPNIAHTYMEGTIELGKIIPPNDVDLNKVGECISNINKVEKDNFINKLYYNLFFPKEKSGQ